MEAASGFAWTQYLPLCCHVLVLKQSEKGVFAKDSGVRGELTFDLWDTSTIRWIKVHDSMFLNNFVTFWHKYRTNFGLWLKLCHIDLDLWPPTAMASCIFSVLVADCGRCEEIPSRWFCDVGSDITCTVSFERWSVLRDMQKAWPTFCHHGHPRVPDGSRSSIPDQRGSTRNPPSLWVQTCAGQIQQIENLLYHFLKYVNDRKKTSSQSKTMMISCF